MGDYHGVNDPVSGVDVKRRFKYNATVHEWAHSRRRSRRSLTGQCRNFCRKLCGGHLLHRSTSGPAGIREMSQGAG
jgi:hypothetical protein